MRTLLCSVLTLILSIAVQVQADVDLNRIPGWDQMTSRQRVEKLRETTPAYKKEALRLVLAEANRVAQELQLPEKLPIEETNLVSIYIANPWVGIGSGLGIGNITTSNYTYYMTVGGKFSYLTKRNLDQDFDCLKAEYQWPLSRIDTNAAYQLAIKWMTAVSMDVRGLNNCPHIEISPWIPEDAKDYFVPVYRIRWSVKANQPYTDNVGNKYEWHSIASVELLLPTKDLRQLRVEESKYILRKPLEVTNLDYLLGLTNALQEVENIKPEVGPKINKAATAVDGEVIKANNAFAIDLYSQLAKQPGNLVVSPFSIDAALTMAYAGARGNTAQQMADVLHFANGDTNIHARLSALLQDLRDTNTLGCQLDIANALWAQKRYPFLPSFQQFLVSQYNATLNAMDLGWPGFDPRKAEAARKQINESVAGQTHDKITEIVPKVLPDEYTRLILVNAIYFKGLWATPFDKKLTKDAPFHVSAEKSVSVPTMRIKAELKYSENDNLQVLGMPYRSNQLSMVILLPKKSDGLAELEKTLTVSDIEQLLQAGSLQEVNVSLPKFKETSGFDLKKALQDLGMVDAFLIKKADFSGISDPSDLFIEAILHKAYVSVDEEGTEAAAATAFFIASSMSVMFNANHPFLFLIKDNSTSAILFMGRVTNPLQ
jgi:serpin B